MRPIVRLLLVIALVRAGVGSSFAHDLLEERGFFRVKIAEHDVRLESLVVKRADAESRLPIALITHGKPLTLTKMLDVHATDLIGQAKDMARRGWLAAAVVRRGFGQSDGPLPVTLSCRSTSLVERFSAEADDLQAALDLLARRPDADPTRAIAIGESNGGAVAMALAARNPKNLLAVVNVSGGLRMQSCPKEDALVAAFKAFGQTSRVPSLWLYARNDSFFGPDLVQRMRTAFLDGGGDAKLVMFDPIGSDGHAMFGSGAGRLKWLMEMDGFLRFHGLPTWPTQDVDALMQKVKANARVRNFFESYVAAPSEKALAQASGGDHWHSAYGYKTIEEARTRAVEFCQQKKPDQKCAVIMENDRWVGGGT
jgi:dienelactone hydrolase